MPSPGGGKATSLVLQLLIAALAGTEVPPDDSKCVTDDPTPIYAEVGEATLNFFMIPVCKKHYWYCLESAEVDWSEWLPVSGAEIVGAPGGGTIGKSIAHTVTNGQMWGVDLGITVSSFNQLIKSTAAEEILGGAFGGSHMWTYSEGETATTTINENCPEDITCGLVLTELRLIGYGHQYVDVQPEGGPTLFQYLSNCSPVEEEAKQETGPFAVYWPVLKEKAQQDPAKIRHDICYIDTPAGSGGIDIECPGETTFDFTADPNGLGPEPPALRPDTTLPTPSHTSEPRPPTLTPSPSPSDHPPEPSPSGPPPEPSSSDPPPEPSPSGPQPEPSPASPPPEPSPSGPPPPEVEQCWIGGIEGYCEDEGACNALPDRRAEYGEQNETGSYPCTGGDSWQCCIPASSETPAPVQPQGGPAPQPTSSVPPSAPPALRRRRMTRW